MTTRDVDNTDLSLRPGMTAVATIVSTERNGVLLVPNTALRFTPASAKVSAAANKSSGGILSKMMPRPPRSSGAKSAGTDKQVPGARQIWILKDGNAVAVTVQTGISDGRMTEVQGEGIEAGAQVITDQRSSVAAS